MRQKSCILVIVILISIRIIMIISARRLRGRDNRFLMMRVVFRRTTISNTF